MELSKTTRQNCENVKLLGNILKKVTIRIDFYRKGIYFAGDTQKRNIYKITVSRQGTNSPFKWTNERFGSDIYEYITFKFGDSIANTENNTKPDQYDILCAMKSDGLIQAQNFNEFCDELGYSNDSIKAKKLYKKVCIQRDKILKLFTIEELEAFPD